VTRTLKINVCRILVGKLKERDCLEKTGMNYLKGMRLGSWKVFRGRTRTRIFFCEKFLNLRVPSKAINLLTS
jgi:hypothetical protein